jgi:hypothetical protein
MIENDLFHPNYNEYVDINDNKKNKHPDNLIIINKKINHLNKVKIRYYISRNSYIVNALTGEKTKYKIGTTDENLFFVVRDISNNHLKIFYENPESYENAHYIKLSENIKCKWYEKNKLLKLNNHLKNLEA